MDPYIEEPSKKASLTGLCAGPGRGSPSHHRSISYNGAGLKMTMRWVDSHQANQRPDNSHAWHLQWPGCNIRLGLRVEETADRPRCHEPAQYKQKGGAGERGLRATCSCLSIVASVNGAVEGRRKPSSWRLHARQAEQRRGARPGRLCCTLALAASISRAKRSFRDLFRQSSDGLAVAVAAKGQGTSLLTWATAPGTCDTSGPVAPHGLAGHYQKQGPRPLLPSTLHPGHQVCCCCDSPPWMSTLFYGPSPFPISPIVVPSFSLSPFVCCRGDEPRTS